MTGRRSHGRLSALNGVVHQGRRAPDRPAEKHWDHWGEAFPETAARAAAQAGAVPGREALTPDAMPHLLAVAADTGLPARHGVVRAQVFPRLPPRRLPRRGLLQHPRVPVRVH